MLAIAHGGGGLDGTPYTNSFEALNASYARGFRWFELDFKRTADGAVACRHDWKDFGEEAPTLSALRDRFEPAFTPIDAEGLGAWMASHPDVTLVTDVKEDDQVPVLADLATAGVDASRTVVQLFDPSEADRVEAAGFSRRSIILYRYDGPRDRLAGFLSGGGAQAVGISLAQARDGYLGDLPPVPTWVYTVNTNTDADALRSAGAAAIFTDDLRPGEDELTAARPNSLFVYGTLLDAGVRQKVFGHDLLAAADTLPGYEKDWLGVRDGAAVKTSGVVRHPIVRPSPGGSVAGAVLTLSDADLDAADAYEGADYARVPVRLTSGATAWLYAEKP